MRESLGISGPQEFFIALCMTLQPNEDLVAKFRIHVVNKIMMKFSFGKYKPNKTERITLADIVNQKK